LLKYLLIPCDTQLITDLGVGFVLCGDVQALLLQHSVVCLWADKRLCRKNRADLYL